MVLTDTVLLKECLSFSGDDVSINKLLMKIGFCHIEVQVKPETFRGLRLVWCLIGDLPNVEMD